MFPPMTYELALLYHAERIAHAEARRCHRPDRGPRRRPERRRVLSYLVAAALLPALVGGWSLSTALSPTAPDPAQTFALAQAPAHDAAKLTAVIVAGATGAESLDVLAPYEVLAASGRFNVYMLAPDRRPLPLFAASPNLHAVDLVAHYTFDQFDREFDTAPDLVVVPWVPDTLDVANEPMVSWLRENVTADTTLLTICGGSWVAADAGLLDGRDVTTHRNLFSMLERQHPGVRWVQGRRWVEDGNVISSAGITAAIDATLRATEKLTGRAAAEQTAQRLGYPHLGFLDDPTFTVPIAGASIRTLNAAFRPHRPKLGVVLYDGVDEIELASLVDLHPRTYSHTIHAIGVEPGLVTTRHGLHLAPRRHLGNAPSVDRVLVPGTPPNRTSRWIETLAASDGLAVDHVHPQDGTFAFDAALADIARRDSRASARLVATGIEYPVADEGLVGRPWPYELLARPLALILVGVVTAALLSRRRRHQEAEA